jgi:NAD(P)H-flavin reductase
MTQDPGWEGETRKVDAQFFRDHLGQALTESTFLVAGPPGMVEGVQQALDEAGVHEDNVLAERYSGY